MNYILYNLRVLHITTLLRVPDGVVTSLSYLLLVTEEDNNYVNTCVSQVACITCCIVLVPSQIE
jgi:hypothetical protein